MSQPQEQLLKAAFDISALKNVTIKTTKDPAIFWVTDDQRAGFYLSSVVLKALNTPGVHNSTEHDLSLNLWELINQGTWDLKGC